MHMLLFFSFRFRHFLLGKIRNNSVFRTIIRKTVIEISFTFLISCTAWTFLFSIKLFFAPRYSWYFTTQKHVFVCSTNVSRFFNALNTIAHPKIYTGTSFGSKSNRDNTSYISGPLHNTRKIKLKKKEKFNFDVRRAFSDQIDRRSSMNFWPLILSSAAMCVFNLYLVSVMM